MSGEMRAQRLEPCEPDICDPPSVSCPGCNGDGTRWVTVGTLRQPNHGDLKVWFYPDELLVDRPMDAVEMSTGFAESVPLYIVEDES